MPREIPTTTPPEDIVTFESLKEAVALRENDVRIDFNMTHLDALADMLNKANKLEAEEGITGEQLMLMIYNEIFWNDTGKTGALKAIDLANDYSALVANNGFKPQEIEQKQKKIKNELISQKETRIGLNWIRNGFFTGAIIGLAISATMMVMGSGFDTEALKFYGATTALPTLFTTMFGALLAMTFAGEHARKLSDDDKAIIQERLDKVLEGGHDKADKRK